MRNACPLVGIEAITVADAKRNHSWCKAKINGVWYNFDSTVPFFVGSFLRDGDVFKDEPEGPTAVMAHPKNLRTRWALKLKEWGRRHGLIGRKDRKLLNEKNERVMDEEKNIDKKTKPYKNDRNTVLSNEEERNEEINNNERSSDYKSWDLALYGITPEEMNNKTKEAIEKNIANGNKKAIENENEMLNEKGI